MQLWLCTTYVLGTNFHTAQEAHWYNAWRRSSYEQPGNSILIDIQCINYSCHSTSILERQKNVQLWLWTMYRHGTIFCLLHTTQEVHWYNAWRRPSYEQPGSTILIDIQCIYYSCHGTSILERQKKYAVLAVYDVRTWNKFLSAPHHLGISLIPCLEVFIVPSAGQQHLH